MKTSELKDLALDWAVATANGEAVILAQENWDWYSSDWERGGPIIEREGITIQRVTGALWDAFINNIHHADGPTPLIAAMRCYVTSKLGDTVDIPKELTKGEKA